MSKKILVRWILWSFLPNKQLCLQCHIFGFSGRRNKEVNWRGSNLPEVMCNNSGEGSIFPKYGQKFENKCCGEFAFQNVKFYQEKKKPCFLFLQVISTLAFLPLQLSQLVLTLLYFVNSLQKSIVSHHDLSNNNPSQPQKKDKKRALSPPLIFFLSFTPINVYFMPMTSIPDHPPNKKKNFDSSFCTVPLVEGRNLFLSKILNSLGLCIISLFFFIIYFLNS